jgi:hypothetical protein
MNDYQLASLVSGLVLLVAIGARKSAFGMVGSERPADYGARP